MEVDWDIIRIAIVAVYDGSEAREIEWSGDNSGLHAVGGEESGHVDHGNEVAWRHEGKEEHMEVRGLH